MTLHSEIFRLNKIWDIYYAKQEALFYNLIITVNLFWLNREKTCPWYSFLIIVILTMHITCFPCYCKKCPRNKILSTLKLNLGEVSLSYAVLMLFYTECVFSQRKGILHWNRKKVEKVWFFRFLIFINFILKRLVCRMNKFYNLKDIKQDISVRINFPLCNNQFLNLIYGPWKTEKWEPKRSRQNIKRLH